MQGIIDATKLKVSDAGLDFIAHWEVFVPHVYDDGWGNGTIGYGHLWQKDEPREISVDQGRALLEQDAKEVARSIKASLTRSITQPQFDALVSLYYNVGPLWITHGTVVQKINANRLAAAASTILQYSKVNGKTVLGVVRRRHAERRLFLEGTY